MRAKGRSPTSAIAPPASIENHAGGQSPSQISIKLLGCQQSQIASSLVRLCGPRSPEQFGNTPFLVVLPHNSHRHITVVVWPQRQIPPAFWHSRSALRSHPELHSKVESISTVSKCCA